MAKITVTENGVSKDYHFKDLFTAGRSSANTCALADAAASRKHFEVRLQDGKFYLADLGSRNGTRLNGAPVTAPKPVKSGDQITVGSAVLEFSDTAEAAAAPEPEVAPAATEPAATQTAYLEVIGAQERYHLDRAENTLGRKRENTIVLSVEGVSGTHSKVLKIDDAYYLEDAGSKNGTFLNGQKIETRQQLKSGDRVTLGSAKLFFKDPAKEPVAATKIRRKASTRQSEPLEHDLTIGSTLNKSNAAGTVLVVVLLAGVLGVFAWWATRSRAEASGQGAAVENLITANPGFELVAADQPLHWSLEAPQASDSLTADASTAVAPGRRSARLQRGAAGEGSAPLLCVYDQALPVEGGKTYSVLFQAKGNLGASLGGVLLRFQDASGKLIHEWRSTPLMGSIGDWSSFQEAAVAPKQAASAQWCFYLDGPGGTLWVDDAGLSLSEKSIGVDAPVLDADGRLRWEQNNQGVFRIRGGQEWFVNSGFLQAQIQDLPGVFDQKLAASVASSVRWHTPSGLHCAGALRTADATVGLHYTQHVERVRGSPEFVVDYSMQWDATHQPSSLAVAGMATAQALEARQAEPAQEVLWGSLESPLVLTSNHPITLEAGAFGEGAVFFVIALDASAFEGRQRISWRLSFKSIAVEERRALDEMIAVLAQVDDGGRDLDAVDSSVSLPPPGVDYARSYELHQSLVNRYPYMSEKAAVSRKRIGELEAMARRLRVLADQSYADARVFDLLSDFELAQRRYALLSRAFGALQAKPDLLAQSAGLKDALQNLQTTLTQVESDKVKKENRGLAEEFERLLQSGLSLERANKLLEAYAFYQEAAERFAGTQYADKARQFMQALEGRINEGR